MCLKALILKIIKNISCVQKYSESGFDTTCNMSEKLIIYWKLCDSRKKYILVSAEVFFILRVLREDYVPKIAGIQVIKKKWLVCSLLQEYFDISYDFFLIYIYNIYNIRDRPWISNWRDHGTLTSIVSHHGFHTSKNFSILEWLKK